jgi:site-specific recombinase XerD
MRGTRRERPRGRRAAARDKEFSSSDVACHVTLRFVSERGSPFSVAGFQKLIARAGATGFKFQLHPHMLRHSCGYKLANDGVDTRSLHAYLGHRSIQHTVRYAELAPGRFKSFWKD